MARITINTEADKAAFFRRLGGYYDKGATKEVKPADRESLAKRAEAARSHAETYKPCQKNP